MIEQIFETEDHISTNKNLNGNFCCLKCFGRIEIKFCLKTIIFNKNQFSVGKRADRLMFYIYNQTGYVSRVLTLLKKTKIFQRLTPTQTSLRRNKRDVRTL